MEKVSIVIPCWNKCELTRNCLLSLKEQVFKDYLIYVVDNGSSDGTVNMVKDEFPDVIRIENKKNLGFAGGVNSGIVKTKGEYVVLLNNDTEVDPMWLQHLVDVMDDNLQYSFGSSMALQFNNRDIIDTVGDGYTLYGLGFKIAGYERDEGQFSAPFEVMCGAGVAPIYRKKMLDQIGLFDEDFFAYMEDVDISLRAQLAGYRGVSIPMAKVYHMVSMTSGGDISAFSMRMTVKNSICIFAKTIPGILLFFMIPLMLMAQIVLLYQVFITNKNPGFRKYIRYYFIGWIDGIKLIPKMISRRKYIHKTRAISVLDFMNKILDSQRQKGRFWEEN